MWSRDLVGNFKKLTGDKAVFYMSFININCSNVHAF